MILEAILALAGVSAVASVANIFMKNREVPKESISLKKHLSCDLPVITLSNNGNKFKFLVDTGSNVCHLGITAFNKVKYESVDKVNNNTLGIGGNSTQELSCKAIFTDELGNSYNMELLVSNSFEESMKSIEEATGVMIEGLIGVDFLQKYKYTVDFKTLEVYTRK